MENKKENVKTEDGNLPISNISESVFIDTFKNAVYGDIWKYVDDADYSRGMEQMNDEEIEIIAKDLFSELHSY